MLSASDVDGKSRAISDPAFIPKAKAFPCLLQSIKWLLRYKILLRTNVNQNESRARDPFGLAPWDSIQQMVPCP